MKVNSNRDISFKSLYNNKFLKKSLEFAADNGALFGTTTAVAFSVVARPAAIALAPNAEKEDKKLACIKSYASNLTQFILTFALANPISNAINNITNNPEKYLTQKTIQNYKKEAKKLCESKSYEFATQLFKLGVSFVVAMPKAILTAAFMPIILQVLSKKNKINEQQNLNGNISFKKKPNEKIAKTIGKTLDKKQMQKFSDKYKDSNFVMHIMALTDTLTTATFIHQTQKSKKIKEKRKKALIYNAGISTGLSIASSYILDKLTEKPTEKFIKKFAEANKGDANLEKQIRGIKIAKPLLLLSSVYYVAIPFASTILAEIASNKNSKHNCINHLHK